MVQKGSGEKGNILQRKSRNWQRRGFWGCLWCCGHVLLSSSTPLLSTWKLRQLPTAHVAHDCPPTGPLVDSAVSLCSLPGSGTH